MNIGVAGQFEIHVYDGAGTLREYRPMQPNLITDTGLVAMMQGHILSSVVLGSGGGEPQKTDTKLTAPLPAITGGSPSVSEGRLYDRDGQYYTYCTALFRVRNTDSTAAVVKELGLWDGVVRKVATHALIKLGGNPAPITLQPGWYMDIAYEMRAYYNKGVISKDVGFAVGGGEKTYHTRTGVWPQPDGKRLYASYHPANFSNSNYEPVNAHAYPSGLAGDRPPPENGGIRIGSGWWIDDSSVSIQGDSAVVELPLITMREGTNISGGKVTSIGLFGGGLLSHAIEFKDDAGGGIPKDELSAIDFRFRYTVSRYSGTLEERP